MMASMKIHGYGKDGPDGEEKEKDDADYCIMECDESESDTQWEKYGFDGSILPPCEASRGMSMECPQSSSVPHQHRSSLKKGGTCRRPSLVGYSGEIIVKLPGVNTPVRRRTSICFDKTERVKEVASMSSLMDDPKELWFQADEFRKIQKKARLITFIAMHGGDGGVGAKQLCTRGLERHINNKAVYKEQSMARKSVFLTQNLQRANGTNDEDMVAKAYQLASMESQARARIRGCEDEAIIMHYTRQTRRMMR
eukprot:scaffold1087_cov136-Cylindrotheca_fusiformis.AAC.12